MGYKSVFKSKANNSYRERLEKCCSLEENQTCADCGEKNPSWASILAAPESGGSKMGVFCCYKCCSYHFQLGRDVCVVKNLKIPDDWSDKEVKIMESSGNCLSNAIYQGLMKAGQKPSSSDHEAQALFVEAKYKRRTFFCKQTYDTHQSWFTFQKEYMGTKNHSLTQEAACMEQLAAYSKIFASLSATKNPAEDNCNGKQASPTSVDLGYGDDARTSKTQDVDLGYGDVDLGYGPTNDQDPQDQEEDEEEEDDNDKKGVDESLARILNTRSLYRRGSVGKRDSLGHGNQTRSSSVRRQESVGPRNRRRMSVGQRQDSMNLSRRGSVKPGQESPSGQESLLGPDRRRSIGQRQNSTRQSRRGSVKPGQESPSGQESLLGPGPRLSSGHKEDPKRRTRRGSVGHRSREGSQEPDGTGLKVRRSRRGSVGKPSTEGVQQSPSSEPKKPEPTRKTRRGSVGHPSTRRRGSVGKPSPEGVQRKKSGERHSSTTPSSSPTASAGSSSDSPSAEDLGYDIAPQGGQERRRVRRASTGPAAASAASSPEVPSSVDLGYDVSPQGGDPPRRRGVRRSSTAHVTSPAAGETTPEVPSSDDLGYDGSSQGERLRINVSQQLLRRRSSVGASGGDPLDVYGHCRGEISADIEHQIRCRHSFRRSISNGSNEDNTHTPIRRSHSGIEDSPNADTPGRRSASRAPSVRRLHNRAGSEDDDGNLECKTLHRSNVKPHSHRKSTTKGHKK